jgi:3-hydroxyacyl-[acyl-carrier-protein] dehydratase
MNSHPTITENEALWGDGLKHLSSPAVEAAHVFRQTGHARYLPAVVRGILERYVDPKLQSRLRTAHDNPRLAQDLGLDSLSLMEIALAAEDATGLRIEHDELRHLATVRDLERALARKRPLD